jgi:dTDP-3-amino-3,4,6-trideoxy-alpha-D-glucose transaminase
MIRLNDFARQWQDCRAELEKALAKVLESGSYILGREVEEFELALAGHWGFAHACGVASGQDALEIGLRVLGCQPGDRVLTTPLSAFATTLAIVRLAAVPVFVDTTRHGLIDLARCRKVFESRRDIHFFVPVHLYGHALDMQELSRLRHDFSLSVVEDCAQSIGATFQGVVTGSAGQMAATSFYPSKNLGAIGDGGALLTNSAALDHAARVLRNYGQTEKYQHEEIGYNSRLDELQAAFLHRAFLPRLDRWITRRREIAARYLAEIRHPDVCPAGQLEGSDSTWHLFPVLIRDGLKQRFMEHLSAQEILTGEHYPILIPKQKALASVPHEIVGDLTNATAIARTEVSLPVHPYLTDDEVASVVRAVNAAPQKHS